MSLYKILLGASCPCNKRITYFIQDIVEYIYVERAVSLGNRGINYVKGSRTE